MQSAGHLAQLESGQFDSVGIISRSIDKPGYKGRSVGRRESLRGSRLDIKTTCSRCSTATAKTIDGESRRDLPVGLPRTSDFEGLSLAFPPSSPPSCRSLSMLLSRKEFNQTTLRIDSTRTKLNRIACSGRGENFSRRMKRHPREIFDEFERKWRVARATRK